MRKSILLTLLTIILGPTSLIPVKAQDLVYVAVQPCRLADTRFSTAGVIPFNTSRNFLVSGANLSNQGGNPLGCVHPKAGTGQEPAAISAYIVAVPTQTSGAGLLTAYPSGQPAPSDAIATVNYAAGQVIGNTTNATLCQLGFSCPPDGQLSIISFNTEQHVVIDVQGYFYPRTIDVDTVILSTQSDGYIGASLSSEVVLVTCPTGSIMTGGAVDCNSDNFDSDLTNFGVVRGAIPSENSFVGACQSEALSHSFAKFGPPVTVYAVCLFDAGAVTAQAASASVATVQAASVSTGSGTLSQPTQGEPSEETLLVVESLRKQLAEREALINSSEQ